MKKNQLLIVGLVLLTFLGIPQLSLASTTPYIKIDGGATRTYDREVKLSIQGKTDSTHMEISNSSDFSEADWEVYSTSKTWYLDYGKGTKTVYIRFKNSSGAVSATYSDSITLYAASTMEVDFVINPSGEDDDDGEDETNSRYINIRLDYSDGVEGYIISNSDNFSGKDYSSITNSEISWILSSGTGKKTVYIKFIDVDGRVLTINKKIYYTQGTDYIEAGTILKGQSSSIYYLGYDGQIHPFLSGLVYHSWYSDFSNIKYVSNAKLSQYKMGDQVCVRPGTWLLKFKGLPKVYTVEYGCILRPIASEAEAYILYGKNWGDRVLELDMIYMSGYNIVYMGEKVDYFTGAEAVISSTKPYISSIRFNDNSDEKNIDKGDSIVIKFSEAIKPTSINSYLVKGDYLTGIGSTKIGGISVLSDGRITVKGIASFDIGTVENSSTFVVRLSLNQTANILTITLSEGEDIEIEDRDYSSAKQIGGVIKDIDGNIMVAANISVPNSISDEENNNTVDNDKDGLSYDIESKYGTSDKKEDTDGDNLTDYEEVNYWFSDPIDPDTDGDGYKDGSEIVNGFSPSGPQKLENTMENKYLYPIGSVIKGKTSGKLYYRDYNGKFYYLSSAVFSGNNFQEKFIINENFNIAFGNSGNLGTKIERIIRPQTYNDGSLVNL